MQMHESVVRNGTCNVHIVIRNTYARIATQLVRNYHSNYSFVTVFAHYQIVFFYFFQFAVCECAVEVTNRVIDKNYEDTHIFMDIWMYWVRRSMYESTLHT